MPRRRNRTRNNKLLKITLKSGKTVTVRRVGMSHSGKSLKVVYPEGRTGYVQHKQIEELKELNTNSRK